MKRWIALLLTLIMVLSAVPAAAFAAPTDEAPAPSADAPLPIGSTFCDTMTNPLYSGETSALQGQLIAPLFYSAAAVDPADYTEDEAQIVAAITTGLEQRKATISVPWKMRVSDIYSEDDFLANILAALLVAGSHTGVPTQGDYLTSHYESINYGGQIDDYDENYYYLTAVYEVTYLTTASQEAAVTAKLEQVISGFGFTAQTDDYTKIKTVYDYLCANVTYDHSTDGSLLKHSAYAALINGKAVCQGYASLLYRMLLEVGVDCRVITGDTNGDGESDHTWNIALLDNFYYNLDSTWDAGAAKYSYFLRCPKNFADHVRDEAYDTQEFHTYYPMAPADYNPDATQPVASGTCGEGVHWALGRDGILTVFGKGAMEDYDDGSLTPWSDYREYILGVVVAEGVTHVGNYAFSEFDKLFAVSVEGAKTIGKSAFSYCSNLLAVDLLEGVEEIGANAFYRSSMLEALSVPSTLKKSDKDAFNYCDSLTAVIITDLAAWCGIDFVSDYGSYHSNPLCSGALLYLNDEPVTEPVIPESVKRIHPGVFYNSAITSVTIHAGVEEIGAGAFESCETLEKVFITDLAAWCNIAFTNITSNPLYFGNALYLNGKKVTDLVIGTDITTVAPYAFVRADIASVTITNPSTVLGSYAFAYSALNSLTLPVGLSAIPDYAFTETQLKSLVLPEGITKVGEYAFYLCKSLAEITVPSTLRETGFWAFYSGPVRKVYLCDLAAWCNMTESSSSGSPIGNGAYLYLNGEKITNLVIPEGIEVLRPECFAYCRNEMTVTFPQSLKEIKSGAFYGLNCKNLHIPENVTHIGNSAFRSAELEQVTFDGVEYIGNSAFDSCWSLRSVSFGDKLREVGQYAFNCDSSLESITFPASLEVLGERALANCHSVKTITFEGAAPTFGFLCFEPVTATAYYPAGDPTWTADVRQQYGGTITWKAACSGPHTEVIDKAVAVTCTEDGLTEGKHCSACGMVLVAQQVIPSEGHKVENGKCSACGKVYIAITTQPKSVTVKKGATATVKVAATGEGLKYQWYYTLNSTDPQFRKSSTTSATYTTTMDASRDGRQLYCVITDKNGYTAQSNTVTLSMAQSIPLKITTQPTSVTVKNGATASVKVVAQGEGLKYQWYYTLNSTDPQFRKSSTTTATYTTTMDSSRDGRQVYCIVTDAKGNTVQSNTVTLSMAKLKITQQPTDVTAKNGESASVKVVAQGEGLKYQWYYTSNSTDPQFRKSSNTTATYSTTMDASRDGRQVYCVVTDKYGNKAQTNTVTLNMEKAAVALKITQQPTDVTAKNGESASVKVVAQGEGLKYQWYYTLNSTDPTFRKSSTTSATYTTTMDASRAGRQVYCVVTDANGNTVKSNTVTLSMAQEGTSLKITQQPADVTVKKGTTASVKVVAQGEGLKYQWYYTSRSGEKQFFASSNTTATYTTTMDATRAGRQVYCVVTDQYGNSVQSNTVTLHMAELKITQQPTGVTVKKGATASVKVVAEGEGLTYQWYYTSKGGQTQFFKSSTTSATYTTTMDSTRAGRQVYCVITDKAGNTIKTNTVTLNMA